MADIAACLWVPCYNAMESLISKCAYSGLLEDQTYFILDGKKKSYKKYHSSTIWPLWESALCYVLLVLHVRKLQTPFAQLQEAKWLVSLANIFQSYIIWPSLCANTWTESKWIYDVKEGWPTWVNPSHGIVPNIRTLSLWSFRVSMIYFLQTVFSCTVSILGVSYFSKSCSAGLLFYTRCSVANTVVVVSNGICCCPSGCEFCVTRDLSGTYSSVHWRGQWQCAYFEAQHSWEREMIQANGLDCDVYYSDCYECFVFEDGENQDIWVSLWLDLRLWAICLYRGRHKTLETCSRRGRRPLGKRYSVFHLITQS